MNVADVMTPGEDLVRAELPGTRDDALEHLQRREFSSVPVVKPTEDGEEFRGLVSRESLIEQPEEDQLALLVEGTPTTTADTSLSDLAAQMRETGARRIPVIDGGLDGIVTITDVVDAIAHGDLPGDTAVGDLAERTINTTYREAPLTTVERELYYADEAYAVVLDDGGADCGIVTEVDIITAAEVVEGEASSGDSIANQDDDWMWEGIKAVGNRYLPTRNVEFDAGPVAEYMSADLVTASQQRTAQEVAQQMIEHDIEQVPVVAGDDLIGIARDMVLLAAVAADA
jgi:CBS domain-containing protein